MASLSHRSGRASGAIRSGLPLVVGVLAAALLAFVLAAPGSSAQDPSDPIDPADPLGAVSSLVGPDPAVVPERDFANPDTSANARAVERGDFPSLPDKCYKSNGITIKNGPCHLNGYDKSRPTVILWGDSHAWQYQPALENAVSGRNVNLVLFIQGGCPPAIAPPQRPGAYYTKCEYDDALTIDYIEKLVRQDRVFKLILASHWGGYRLGYQRIFIDKYLPGDAGYSEFTAHMIKLAHNGIEPLFKKLGRLKVDVDVVGQAGAVPVHVQCGSGAYDPTTPYTCLLPRWRTIEQESGTTRYLRRLQTHLQGSSRLIDATPRYCNVTVCAPTINGNNTWWDHLHLGKGLTGTMTPYFKPSVDDVVRAANRARR